MSMEEVVVVVLLHALISPTYLFLVDQKERNMDTVMNGKMNMCLVTPEKDRSVTWSFREVI
jgi:hypothetical protein